MNVSVFAASAVDPSQTWTTPGRAIGPPTAYSASVQIGEQQQTAPVLFGFDLSSAGINRLSTIDAISVTIYVRADCPLDPQAGVAVYEETVPVAPPEHLGVLGTIEPWELLYEGPFGVKLTPDYLDTITVGVNGYGYGDGMLHLHAVKLTVHWTPPDVGEDGPL